jgi:LPS export ABC transporter permease LptG
MLAVLDSYRMFRLIDRYLLREIIPYVLLGLLLLTAIIFAHQASRFSELLVVASRNGLPMQALWRVLSALIPSILMFTLPISLLIGILVGLGRLSGDSEVIALEASGVSRIRLLRPVVLLASVMAAVMVYLTFYVLPRSIHSLNDLKANRAVLFQGLKTQIKPRVFEESIPHKVLYVGDIDRARNEWRNIFLVDLGDEQSDLKIFTASRGSLREGARSEMPELYLKDVFMHQVSNQAVTEGAGREANSKSEDRSYFTTETRGVGPRMSAADTLKPKAEEDRSIEKKEQQTYTVAWHKEMTAGLEFSEEKEAEAIGIKHEQRSLAEMTWDELISSGPNGDSRVWLAELHKRLALPAACLVFALLGIGVGISGVRAGRSFGLLLGLLIAIVYYLLALAGEHLTVSGKLPAWLGIWLANIVLSVLGVSAIAIQLRSSSKQFFGRLLDKRHRLQNIDAQAWRRVGALYQSESLRVASPSGRTLLSQRMLRPLLIDKLVASDLVRFFFSILGGFSVLFIIVTLFQLLDSITRNKIEWTVVADYLFFLLPMIANYMTPMAALVAVLVTFGILEKTSQIVALKASGQSIYRLAAPAMALAVLLSCFVFLNQDYVLPFTNRRQDNLRHLIRSGQEPAQTFYQTRHKWIFGGDSRLYNYAHFDPIGNVFARLTLLDLSREPFGIKSRIFARRAIWDPAEQAWLLEDGWERRFDGARIISYETFKQRRIALPERPDYFKKESRESSMMTLAELRQHIADLSQSGFDVLDLRIALYSKIAFPLACLVMVVVGFPFALSVGKRGALYGVAIGIVIGLVYWGALGLFEQMGRYEMLPPVLAAWGPNMMFGAGGLYLLLTSRT